MGEGVVLLITGCYCLSQLKAGDRGTDMWIDYRKVPSNRVVLVGNITFPNIDWHMFNAKGFYGAEFVGCIQEGFLKHYVGRPT